MKTLAVFAALCLSAGAQVPQMPSAVAVCTESQNCVVTAVSSPTAVLQFGVGTTWGPAFSTTKFPQSVSYAAPANTTLSPFDPASGVTKTLVAQQQASAYTVTYTLNGVKTVKTIPGLTTTYKFTCSGLVVVPSGSPMPTTLTGTGVVCTAVKQ